MSLPQTNQMVSEIADMLVSGFDEPPIAAMSKLENERLDFSLDSLKSLDLYLSYLSRKYVAWMNQNYFDASYFDAVSEEQARELLTSTVIRCGAYLGEVVRRATGNGFDWIRHQEWIAVAEEEIINIIGREPEIGTAFMLYSPKERQTWLPLEKVLKHLESGMEDSVFAFAQVVIASSYSNAEMEKPYA